MSEDDPVKAAERRGYAKGYVAGQKRAEREDRAAEISRAEEEFRRQVFLAALQGTLCKGGWRLGDQPVENSEDYCKLAWRFASAAMKGTWFS